MLFEVLLFARYIFNWLYSKKPSIRYILLKLQVLLITTSIICKGNSSFSHASLKSLKFIHIWTFLYSLTIMLANQFGCWPTSLSVILYG